ncbi:hypothetical protein [Chryseobacterium polytrichastri]|uniref:MORN repeat variant n=1 Tax=Chryseobacterium polytrichastri TaxID=1302687 RepID=A0A1M7FRR5_9FLAO|nr:hypothetical protein [Chryseobacterium polytrichastri]SHM06764.1 hypothetical protein SAMN05444267_103326 [Chryseobacterium polytrichastri]
MKIRFLFFLGFLVLVSCTTKMNQYIKDQNKVNKRHGKWREEYSADEGTLVAIGKYKLGEKVGTWKTFLNQKMYQKDKVRKDITKTKKYYSNGNIMERGQSKLDISKTERHWYYFGEWKYYDNQGKPLYMKIYEQGKKADSISYIK